MKAVSLGEKTQYATSTLFLVPTRADRISEGRRLAATMVGETERDHALARRGAHPDVIELAPPEGKERVGIDTVRSAIRTAQFAPVQGDRKVCLIPMAEGLTTEAANALLKTLEEPPREMAFVLLAAHTTDLLPTIVSRSRIVRMPPSANSDLACRLRKLGYDNADANWLVSIAYREGEIDRFLEGPIDILALRTAARERVSAFAAGELATACIDGESILRHASLSLVLERAAQRDVGLLTDGVRVLATQRREAIFSFLQDLLAACSECARAEEGRRHGKGLPGSAESVGPQRLRCACTAVEHAHRAFSVYTAPEAVLLSLFLSIGGVTDDR